MTPFVTRDPRGHTIDPERPCIRCAISPCRQRTHTDVARAQPNSFALSHVRCDLSRVLLHVHNCIHALQRVDRYRHQVSDGRRVQYVCERKAACTLRAGGVQLLYALLHVCRPLLLLSAHTQHWQSKGQSAVSPPFPIPSVSIAYIVNPAVSPPATLPRSAPAARLPMKSISSSG